MTGWSVLGTLQAVPALDRPDLLGEPVAHALKALDPADAALVGVAEIDPGLADTAQLTSPVPGSALTASTITFNWTSGVSASKYWLEVGSAPGRFLKPLTRFRMA